MTTRYLQTINAELEQANQDLELYERLQSASGRVAELTKEQCAALAEHRRKEDAEIAAREAERQTQMAKFTNIRVVAGGTGNGPLHRGWKITFTGPAWDATAMRTCEQDVTVHGFRTLALDHQPVFQALIEKYPERIPQEIATLAPGDPWEAFNIFLAAERSGCLPIRYSA